MIKNEKYSPKTKDELMELVNNINLILSYINTSSVTNMSSMFYYCKKFNQDLSRWDVLNVTNKLGIFYRSGIKNEYKPKFK